MGLDINPVAAQGQQLIQSYGDGLFRIAGTEHTGSVLVFREHTVPWPVAAPDGITEASLGPILNAAAEIDILLIGCGPGFVAVPKSLRVLLKTHGIVLEWMDTGAACRTFNVLLAEERRIAAALIAVE